MLPTIPQGEISIVRSFLPRTYMNHGELDLLVGLLAAIRPKTVIEFGVNVGLTAQAILNTISTIDRYVGIDVLPGYQTVLRDQQKEVPVNPGWLVRDDERFDMLLRQRGSFDLRPNDLPYADAIFIDGDHSYDAVMNDSALAHERINLGGIIVWHDYNNATVEVTQALEDLSVHDHRRIFNIERTWLAVERF